MFKLEVYCRRTLNTIPPLAGAGRGVRIATESPARRPPPVRAQGSRVERGGRA